MNREKRANFRNFKGITLIALVITIIVLLILAGVSIATLTGQNGILTQAQNAKTETEKAEEKEAISLAYTGAMAEKNGNGTVTASDMNEQFGLNGTNNATATGNIVVKFEYENGTIRWYKVDNRGTIKGPYDSEEEVPTALTLKEMFENGKNCTDTKYGETCTDETHLHIGDYVDYKPASNAPVTVNEEDTGWSENQTYSIDENTTWRVLGITEEGNVLLTSGSPIRKDGSDPYLVMQGAESYINCVDTLDKVCSVYNNPDVAKETRSITAQDINRLGGIVEEKNEQGVVTKIYKESNPSEEIDVGGFLRRTYQYKETNGRGTKDYAPENYMQDKYLNESYSGPYREKYEALTRKSVGDNEPLTAYGYMYETLGVNERIYNMLFSETTEADNYSKSYWLASPGVNDDSSFAGFGPGVVAVGNVASGFSLFYSGGRWTTSGMAVRPVVVLESEITIDQLGEGKLENQAEHEVDWTDDNNNPARAGDYVEGTTGQVDAQPE